jgi:hypothetical protein
MCLSHSGRGEVVVNAKRTNSCLSSPSRETTAGVESSQSSTLFLCPPGDILAPELPVFRASGFSLSPESQACQGKRRTHPNRVSFGFAWRGPGGEIRGCIAHGRSLSCPEGPAGNHPFLRGQRGMNDSGLAGQSSVFVTRMSCSEAPPTKCPQGLPF